MKIIFLIIFAFITCANGYSAEQSTSLGVVEAVEKNLIYSKEIETVDPGDVVVINRGGWNQADTLRIEEQGSRPTKMETAVKYEQDDKSIAALKRKAYDAINIGQYEVAVQLYKDILKKNKNDIYSTLGLATAYQYLGQYVQAKPLYMKALDAFPEDQQIMSNLLSIVSQETPYEAAYLLAAIADKNRASPIMQAQTSVAYTKVKNYEKALEYIEKAIRLDDDNLEYKYNLAVLYDLNENYAEARRKYMEVLSFYDQSTKNLDIPVDDIRNRLRTLQNIR